jgi:hypothetical protein
MRKEELTKRLYPLVYKSQDSCKKVPFGKKAPTDQGQPMGAEGRGERASFDKLRTGGAWGEFQILDFRLQIGDRQNRLNWHRAWGNGLE